MSQNKTVIQGLEPADSQYGGRGSSNNSFYSRGQGAPAKGTVVPGMENVNSREQERPVGSQSQTTAPTGGRPASTGKPIVGFLYSVSRTPYGEYWPLQLGKNVIGKTAEADIILGEATVSDKHAVIIVRQGKNGLIAAIKDSESTNGTCINGEAVDFEAEEVHDGDILTLGKNYNLLFMLIDTVKLGLETSKDFIAVNVEEEDEDLGFDGPVFDRHRMTRDSTVAETWNNPSAQNQPGTVGLDGSGGMFGHGGTVPL